MEENKKQNQNSQKSSQPAQSQGSGLFALTKQKISADIDRYESIIQNDNTVFRSKLPEAQANPIIFKKKA